MPLFCAAHHVETCIFDVNDCLRPPARSLLCESSVLKRPKRLSEIGNVLSDFTHKLVSVVLKTYYHLTFRWTISHRTSIADLSFGFNSWLSQVRLLPDPHRPCRSLIPHDAHYSFIPIIKANPSIYQLKITLLGIQPPILRRIQVPLRHSAVLPA